MRRLRRSIVCGCLGIALSVAASAQVRTLPAEAAAPVGLPPLLIGTPSAPAPLLSSALSLQASAIAALPVPAVSAYLAERAASAAPAERAAAKILAAQFVAAEPARAAAAPAAPGRSSPAAGAAADAGLRELADSARADPSLAAWFDGSKSASSLELGDMKLKRGAWRRGEAKLERLGQGEFGFVDAHPTVPGAVVKTVWYSDMVGLFSNAKPEETAQQEETTARALAAADAGPRYFGRANQDGYLVSVRERVYGDTLEDLDWRRQLGPEERELVLELMRRLAAAGLKPSDLRPPNVMIGRTALDPRRRAYVVDGGGIAAIPAELDAEGRYQDVVNTRIVQRERFDRNAGFIQYARSVLEILDHGVESSQRVTLWQRFKGFMKDLPSQL